MICGNMEDDPEEEAPPFDLRGRLRLVSYSSAERCDNNTCPLRAPLKKYQDKLYYIIAPYRFDTEQRWSVTSVEKANCVSDQETIKMSGQQQESTQ